VPAAAVPAFTVSVEFPEVLTEAGLKLAVAPEGNPLMPRPTLEAKPPSAPIATV